MKIILPTSNGIASVTDNEDGTVTILETNGTSTTFSTGTPTVDTWVEMEIGDLAVGPTWTGSATLNAFTDLSLLYKTIDKYTAVMKVKATVSIDVTALANSVNFNFQLSPITSANTVFTGTKTFSTLHTTDSALIYSPVSVVVTTAVASPRFTVGNVYAGITGSNTLVAVGNTNLQLPNGTYTVLIEFEQTCKLI
jgi:hypothetical protein